MDRFGSLGRLCIVLSVVVALSVVASQVGHHRHIAAHVQDMAAEACALVTGDLHAPCIAQQTKNFTAKATLSESLVAFLALALPAVICAAVFIVRHPIRDPLSPRGNTQA